MSLDHAFDHPETEEGQAAELGTDIPQMDTGNLHTDDTECVQPQHVPPPLLQEDDDDELTMGVDDAWKA